MSPSLIALSLTTLSTWTLATPAAAQEEGAQEENAPEEAAAEEGPRYLSAIRTELAALGVEATCETLDALRARCSFIKQNTARTREHDIRILIDDGSRTAYFYVRVATADPQDERTPAALRRAAELNWTQLSNKIEWNASTGELRLSAVQHLDTNFDRLAFRVLVRLMAREAERFATEFDAILHAGD